MAARQGEAPPVAGPLLAGCRPRGCRPANSPPPPLGCRLAQLAAVQNCLLHVPEDGAGGRYSANNAWQASEPVQLEDQQALPQEILTQCFECGACLLPHLHCHHCPLVYPDWQDVGLPGESVDMAAVVH